MCERPPAIRFAVLGPVRAWRDDVEIELDPPQQKAALAVLLVRAGQAVGLTEIVDVLWPADPPASAVNVVHRSVGRLRRLLEPGLPLRAAGRWLLRGGGGYRLELGESGVVDLLRFRDLCARGRDATDTDEAVTSLLSAVALWQGPCAAGTDPEVRANPLFVAVGREYLAAVEALADVALRGGVPERALPVVRTAAAANEWDEQLQAKLIRTLGTTGRQAEALAVYADVRTRLDRELGIDPGPELTAAHENVLRQRYSAEPASSTTAVPLVQPAQLPADLPTFSGRAAEMARARALFTESEHAGATLVIGAFDGMAGIGKTTLAVHWAHEAADRYPDGQLYVNLRGFDPACAALDPAEAVRGFLEALGVRPQQVPANPDAQAALYRSLLVERRMLILLDNARDEEQVRPLLPGRAGCLVIVTSRNRLAGLVAAEGAHPITLDLPPVAEARASLASRLGADRVTAEPEAVEEIITACGRLPLAMAMVAARAAARPDFPLGAFADELRKAAGSLDAFSGGGATTDARTIFSWSYRTLSPDAARLFRLLASHPGADIATPAAASLTGASPPLAELTRAHLLNERIPGRYAFHDLLRAYATERANDVDTPDERRAALHRVLDHYLHTAFTASRLLSPHRAQITLPAPSTGVNPVPLRDEEQAKDWFTAEYQVLMAAVRQAAEAGFERHAWQLTWVLQTYLDRGGHWHDWATVQRLAVTAAQVVHDHEGLAYSCLGQGLLHSRRQHYEDSHQKLSHALELFRELDNVLGQAHVELVLGSVVARLPGRHADAVGHLAEALRLYRAAGNQIGVAWALNNLGFLSALANDDYTLALDYCQQALAAHQELGDEQGEANAWDSIAFAHARLGNHDDAIAHYERAAELHTALGHRYYLATTLARLGDSHHDAGQVEPAVRAWRRAMAILSELGHPDATAVRDRIEQLSTT